MCQQATPSVHWDFMATVNKHYNIKRHKTLLMTWWLVHEACLSSWWQELWEPNTFEADCQQIGQQAGQSLELIASSDGRRWNQTSLLEQTRGSEALLLNCVRCQRSSECHKWAAHLVWQLNEKRNGDTSQGMTAILFMSLNKKVRACSLVSL